MSLLPMEQWQCLVSDRPTQPVVAFLNFPSQKFGQFNPCLSEGRSTTWFCKWPRLHFDQVKDKIKVLLHVHDKDVKYTLKASVNVVIQHGPSCSHVHVCPYTHCECNSIYMQCTHLVWSLGGCRMDITQLTLESLLPHSLLNTCKCILDL